MSLVEAGYGTLAEVGQMSPYLRRAILYARAEQHGGQINWETGVVTWPNRHDKS